MPQPRKSTEFKPGDQLATIEYPEKPIAIVISARPCRYGGYTVGFRWLAFNMTFDPEERRLFNSLEGHHWLVWGSQEHKLALEKVKKP